ncbi:rhodanese-like domain-containing protein [Fusibacter ferrireducens]|uniref:Rhodanese-like domain-containing protein n=1 Tax=Fusibacter ferrireducens TaxID=2785058 RepID=A0ABR9ZQM3_9FIRM|nr:rhodanese-like domain-containing protein [Fusibacter ferrireducens]MBF4692616.1 rhodanese-like domain-containing protein [Fusibacter ferrireducens]
MNNIIIFAVAIAAYFVFKKITEPKVDKINGETLNQMLKDKTTKRQFIDVRTQSEFKADNIKGFRNIPLQSLASRAKELDKEKPVVLMCASGHRSMQAARILKRLGVETIVNLSGGLSAYRR